MKNQKKSQQKNILQSPKRTKLLINLRGRSIVDRPGLLQRRPPLNLIHQRLVTNLRIRLRFAVNNLPNLIRLQALLIQLLLRELRVQRIEKPLPRAALRQLVRADRRRQTRAEILGMPPRIARAQRRSQFGAKGGDEAGTDPAWTLADLPFGALGASAADAAERARGGERRLGVDRVGLLDRAVDAGRVVRVLEGAEDRRGRLLADLLLDRGCTADRVGARRGVFQFG